MTISLPYTFAGDTTLSSAKLQSNFDAIKAAINGGLASADISATAGFTLSQTAENRNMSFIDVAFYQTGGAFVVQSAKFPLFQECELVDISVLAKKEAEEVNNTQIHFKLMSGSNTVATIDLSEPDDLPGYVRFSPAITLGQGFYSVDFANTTAGNVEMATVRLGLRSKHTKR